MTKPTKFIIPFFRGQTKPQKQFFTQLFVMTLKEKEESTFPTVKATNL